MKQLIRPAIAAIAALVTLAALSAPAQAQSDLRGHWAGYGRSASVTPGPPNLPFFDVFTQNGRRFAGVVKYPDNPEDMPIEGTISAAGVLNATGMDAQGRHIQLHGRVRDIKPPSPNFPPNPCLLAALRYKVTGRGTHDEGFLLFLQDQPAGSANPGPPDIPEIWNGTYTSRRTIASNKVHHNLVQDTDRHGLPLPSFSGTASFFAVFYPPDPDSPNGSFFDVFFDVLGTVGLPAVQADGSASALFAAIGVETKPGPPQGPEDLVMIQVGMWAKPGPPVYPNIGSGPPIIQGRYALYGSFFDVFTDLFNGTAQTFDGGTFQLTAGGG